MLVATKPDSPVASAWTQRPWAVPYPWGLPRWGYIDVLSARGELREGCGDIGYVLKV